MGKKTITVNKKLGSFVAFILAISPILDPYIIFSIADFSIKLMELIMVLLFTYITLSKKNLYNPNKEISLLLGFFFFLTLLSFLAPTEGRNFILGMKVIIIWSLYALFVNTLWKVNLKEKFIRYTIRIAIIGTILIIIQFVGVSFGYNNFFDGKISFLQLGFNEDWAGLIDPNTGDIRVHSFFQESSYFGIYLLPILAYSLKKERIILTSFLFLGLLISSSLVSILGGLAVIILILLNSKLFSEKINIRFWKRVSIISLIAILFIIALYNYNSSVNNIINYSLNRFHLIKSDLSGERLGSTKLRIIGYAKYFETFPQYLRIVGTGAAQYPLYLSQYGVVAYSSTFVTILLNYGLLGITTFVLWCLELFFRTDSDKRIYLFIFILMCFVDNIWFNWYFFYLLTWFLPSNKEKN